jgi:hypothetical protein
MHTTLLCSDAARLTSFRILAPFLPGIPARLLGTEARCVHHLSSLSAVANVGCWIDFLIPWRCSSGRGWRVDIGENAPGPRQYRHCITRLQTPRYEAQTRSVYSSSSFLPSPFIEHQGALDTKSQCSIPCSPQLWSRDGH